MQKKVLIADDNLTSRIILTKNLEKWGYEVIQAEDGNAAWAVLNTDEPPRIAILDWMMPGMDGPQICSKVKKRHSQNLVYTILLTTRNEKSDVLKGFSSGADDYLTKPFDSEELRSRLSAGVRIVDYDCRLREQETTIRVECYNALTELAEARDNETGAHIKRLGKYAGVLARQYNQSEKYIHAIEMFAPMHDIGKVGIPDSILLAPRKLTDEEFEVMKTHTVLGWQIIYGKPTLEMAAEICLSHHERYDGKGYPRSLSGEDIPLCGRITAIADVYDALRSDRPYKKSWTHQDSVEHICSNLGTQFDPVLGACFEKVAGEFEELFSTMRENNDIGDSLPELSLLL